MSTIRDTLDIFEEMSIGRRCTHPVIYKIYQLEDVKAVASETYYTNPFVGFKNYLPPAYLRMFTKAEEDHTISFIRFTTEHRQFILRLKNPFRISLMNPTNFGWKESEVIFARDAQDWYHLNATFEHFRLLYPNSFIGHDY